MTEAVPMIGCASKCGTQIEASKVDAWLFLQITGGYRCWPCEHQLRALSTTPSTAPNTGDPLPSHSIGALKKMPERPELKEKPR